MHAMYASPAGLVPPFIRLCDNKLMTFIEKRHNKDNTCEPETRRSTLRTMYACHGSTDGLCGGL
jgi:hypothetical protein